MDQQAKRTGKALKHFLICLAFLGLLILLENLQSFIPRSSIPKVLLPTSQLFTVLKKGAVYSLIAVSLNLLNGFTGLFSLGQAGFMLLGRTPMRSSPSRRRKKMRSTTCSEVRRSNSPSRTCSA